MLGELRKEVSYVWEVFVGVGLYVVVGLWCLVVCNVWCCFGLFVGVYGVDVWLICICFVWVLDRVGVWVGILLLFGGGFCCVFVLCVYDEFECF